MINKLNKNQILEWRDNPLPGVIAQDIMLPHSSRKDIKVPENFKKAGVMILIFDYKDNWHICLIKRTHHPKDKHAGQVSFPGGQLDSSDNEDMIACAMRESQEEIGIPQSAIQHIASLTPIYVPVSNFMVYPQVGIYGGSIEDFSKQDDEVADLIFSPLTTILANDIVAKQDIIRENQKIKDVPCFDIEGHIVWGATAMILSEFREWIKNSL